MTGEWALNEARALLWEFRRERAGRRGEPTDDELIGLIEAALWTTPPEEDDDED